MRESAPKRIRQSSRGRAAGAEADVARSAGVVGAGVVAGVAVPVGRDGAEDLAGGGVLGVTGALMRSTMTKTIE